MCITHAWHAAENKDNDDDDDEDGVVLVAEQVQ